MNHLPCLPSVFSLGQLFLSSLPDRRLPSRPVVWRADQALPTVAALAAHYQVSPGVVHRVLRRLADEGLVRIVARWGTFLA